MWILLSVTSLLGASAAIEHVNIPPSTTTGPNELCTLSMQRQILTCENLTNNELSAVGHHLTPNTTRVVFIKNSAQLHIPANYGSAELFENINTFHLIGNKRLQVEAHAFHNFYTLTYLKITDNTWNVIGNDSFQGLESLEVLNLVNNNIVQLEVKAFHGLRKLQTLELSHNDFRVLPEGVFADCGNLSSLFLYHNNLEIIEKDALSNLENLSVLDLTYNRIKSIETAMFNRLVSLSHLYLSFNKIDLIEGDFDLASLTFLYLQNNKLRHITGSLFSRLGSLKELDISKNKINTIDVLAFANLKSLMHLNYRDNNITQPIDLVFDSTAPAITS